MCYSVYQLVMWSEYSKQVRGHVIRIQLETEKRYCLFFYLFSVVFGLSFFLGGGGGGGGVILASVKINNFHQFWFYPTPSVFIKTLVRCDNQ